MTDCVFCKIINGTIPSAKIVEDNNYLAVLDIHPNAPGHVLIMPKWHARNALDLPADLWPGLMSRATDIGKAIMKALGAAGFNFMMNNEAAAEQVIFHAHMHIIPRYFHDGLKISLPGHQLENATEIVRKIRTVLHET